MKRKKEPKKEKLKKISKDFENKQHCFSKFLWSPFLEKVVLYYIPLSERTKTMAEITVVGAGLAGAEAAWQLCRRGQVVTLREMKPEKRSPAHQRDTFAELVCSNSLRSDRLENAVGLLKEELRELDSLILACADSTRVPAGSALAVDREGFTELVTKRLLSLPNLKYVPGEVTDIPASPCIIATGPLTSGALYERISTLVGQPYLNSPMTKEEYFAFYHALIEAQTAELHSFETPRVFEGCMPVEVMAKRGEMTLAYGPLKPVGLEVDGKMPFAVVQLRQDDRDGRLYNIVGFQTNLKFSEQKRVFGLIPGLEHAEFVRYGVMHRNSFLPSPGLLSWDYSLKTDPLLCFAGQMTGVEGYVESASSGLLAALALHEKLLGRAPVDFTDRTAIGALGHYVSEYVGHDFQPMNVTFGIMAPAGQRFRGKQQKNLFLSERALATVREKKALLSPAMES